MFYQVPLIWAIIMFCFFIIFDESEGESLNSSLYSLNSCNQLHRDNNFISYIPENQMKLPPVLLSFPGSGNTVTRLLLETATGYLTGSVYEDGSLYSILRGEKTCGLRTIAVKAHTGDFYILPIKDGGLELKLPNHSKKRKCSKGSITGFKRVILLVRDPYDAILSHFHLMTTGNHSGILTDIQSITMHEEWLKVSKELSEKLRIATHVLIEPMLTYMRTENLLVIKYVDLIKNTSTRISTLRNIVAFTGFNTTEERLACAFAFIDEDNNNNSKAIHRRHSSFTKEEAYVMRTVVCDVWNNVRNYSTAFGYSIFNDTKC